jgi:hypothetical protein
MAKINQKYFGNRNIGTGGQQLTVDENGNVITPADDKIGGEGVDSVTPNNEGTYTSGLPTATFSAPDLPGGVTATGIVHGHALSAATTSNGSSYRVDDVLTVADGTKTSAATFPVSAIITLSTPTLVNGGTNYDATNGTIGDKVTFRHANFSTPLRVRVTASSTGVATAITVEQAGVWTGSGAAPTTITGGSNGFTATTSGGPVDTNGVGMVISFTAAQWGAYSFGTVVVQGDYTVMPSNPASFTGGSGTGAAATITFGVSGIEITEKGSGYTSVSDAAITFSSGIASYTSVLTTDSGAPGSSTNQENAIIAYAKINDSITNAEVADIIKQRGTKRFKVKTATGTAICELKSGALSPSASTDTGKMTIGAVDDTNGTYYVTKIGGRRCTVVQNNGTAFATNSSVPWVLSKSDPSYDAATTVVIANA